MALRWKKNPMSTGLARIACGPQGSTLRDGDTKYASTGTYSRHDKRKGWYWVAIGQGSIPYENTCNQPVADEATAKAAAMAYVRECLKATPTAAHAATKQDKE